MDKQDPHTEQPDKLYYTTGQVAEMSAISSRKVWEEANGGHLKATRFGRAVRFHIDDIKAWHNAKRGVPNEPHN